MFTFSVSPCCHTDGIPCGKYGQLIRPSLRFKFADQWQIIVAPSATADCSSGTRGAIRLFAVASTWTRGAPVACTARARAYTRDDGTGRRRRCCVPSGCVSPWSTEIKLPAGDQNSLDAQRSLLMTVGGRDRRAAVVVSGDVVCGGGHVRRRRCVHVQFHAIIRSAGVRGSGERALTLTSI